MRYKLAADIARLKVGERLDVPKYDVLGFPQHPTSSSSVTSISWISEAAAAIRNILLPPSSTPLPKVDAPLAVPVLEQLSRVASLAPVTTTDTETMTLDDDRIFIASLTSLAKEGRLQASLVEVYKKVTELLRAKQSPSCDILLSKIAPEDREYKAELLITFLMATSNIREALPSRAGFANRVRQRFVEELGATEADEVLRGIA